MGRSFFMRTERIGFSRWEIGDAPLAESLWGDEKVTRYICASGRFEPEEIAGRLALEISNGDRLNIQYWPVFELETGAFIGCCGLRPRGEQSYEIGFHLKPAFWGRGYASEAARAVIHYAFDVLRAKSLFAGHNPANAASACVLRRLGFVYTGDEYYAPTGLYHPSYEMINPNSI